MTGLLRDFYGFNIKYVKFLLALMLSMRFCETILWVCVLCFWF